MTKVLLEVCVDSAESVTNAIEGGADRLELCSGLMLGGLTPSIGLARFALAQGKVPAYALIRPRNGHFVFSADEVTQMCDDITALRQVGVSGFVIGALTPDAEVDIAAMSQLIQATEGADITFHRAFDQVVDPCDALEQLIKLGVSRILTSGQQANALQGAELLGELQRQAGQRLSVMAGAGVDSSNAQAIISASGISEIHASCKRVELSDSTGKQDVAMGSDGGFDQQILVTDPRLVTELKQIVTQI
jgi:copper homeostasis protein